LREAKSDHSTDPRLVEAAKHDPTLDYMIEKGIPSPGSARSLSEK
jgi:hypothetical protein